MRQVLIVRLYQLVSLEIVKSQNQVPVIACCGFSPKYFECVTSFCVIFVQLIFILYLNIWSDFIFDSELVKLIWDPISSASIWQRLHFDWIVLCFWLIVIFQGKTFQLHASIIWMLPLCVIWFNSVEHLFPIRILIDWQKMMVVLDARRRGIKFTILSFTVECVGSRLIEQCVL